MKYLFLLHSPDDGVPAPGDPWSSKSIEWQLPSPVPVQNFDRIPVFSSDPYGYGEGRPVAVPAGLNVECQNDVGSARGFHLAAEVR